MLILDLTHPLDESTPVYHDERGYVDPPTRLTPWVGIGDAVSTTEHRSPFRVTRLEMGLHTGTHVDAPAHFAPDGDPLGALPISALAGLAVVVDLLATAAQARSHHLVLFRERASAVGTIPLLLMPPGGSLPADAVAEVISWRRPLICIRGDVDGGDADCPATAALLRAGAFLAVDLSSRAEQVRDGDLLVVAPLSLGGVEGAPARVLAIRTEP